MALVLRCHMLFGPRDRCNPFGRERPWPMASQTHKSLAKKTWPGVNPAMNCIDFDG
jgi:hypothetical protein